MKPPLVVVSFAALLAAALGPAASALAAGDAPLLDLCAEQVREARGFADSFALRLRHHDESVHARGAPVEPLARSVYDAIEQVRYEAVGARMEGVRANLDSATAREPSRAPTRHGRPSRRRSSARSGSTP